MTIREAVPGDEKAIFALVCALAEYERAPEEVVNTPEKLAGDLFSDPVCEALVVESEDGTIVGFALYYTSYSTWKGRCLYLEDFFVLPEYRRGGIGSTLFQRVVEIARNRGVRRMDWQVLDWNEPAMAFYRRQGAILDDGWINGRLFF